ncbi:MAG TPA: type II CRISPR RNA-guided endonuclease Cas9 [Anaerohalosphaeraceae bacterium]|nr:type II CRISPR RNA-guided endonuclease Cas9 [Anaerohalosphaeraceae bacterium]
MYTLGLDIGSNSVGWAVLNPEKELVINAGVRVFQEGVDRDTKGAEVSKNAARRAARSARRTRKRRNYRKDKLFRLLVRSGLLPQNPAEQQILFQKDPYYLRAKGLDEKLEPYEIGRVLYHFSQRRGFWSNRKSEKKKEEGIVAKSASELQKQIVESGCRTLGEFFAKLNPHEQRIRGRYTFRAMYEDEFEKVWQTQSCYYQAVLTDTLKTEIKDRTIFYQRPLKPSDELIGNCELEPNEKRCPKADWYARRFRILQTLNNLEIHNPDGTDVKLNETQRQIVLQELLSSEKVKFDTLRKKLGLLETQTFNLEEGPKDQKKESIQGDEFNAHLRKSLGKKLFEQLAEQDLIEINDLLLDDALQDEEVVEKLMERYGFTQEQAQKILEVPLPQKYMSFSRLAVRKLLPHMEKGLLTHEAIQAVYGSPQGRRPVQTADQLPFPEDLRNPIVNRALWEVRKVVNALVRVYGKPQKIKLEMARELKGTKREREEIQLRQRQNEEENKKAREELMRMGILSPSRDDIIKYKLWQECGQVCPYTGRPISQNALFGPHPEFQVEHILPYSRTLDDSFMNKTLCAVDENRRKGDRTPYEFYGETEQFEQILHRIAKLPYPKRRRFWQKEVELDNFIQRQLNDTRYISRKAEEYLRVLGCTVQGTRGQVTAELRHQWGLNSILDDSELGEKKRDDLRHHAIDAAVVAVTENRHLRDLARSRYVPAGQAAVRFAPPWEGFRQQLQEVVSRINVSHRVTRKVSGPLHEETSYGPTGLKDDKGQDIYVYRKPLDGLTLAMVPKIVDPVVRQIVVERLEQFGLKPGGDGKITKEVWKEPLRMKTKSGQPGPQIRSVRIRDVFNNLIPIKDKDGRPYRYVAPGSNHHIEIFEYTDAKGRTKRQGRVVSMFEAVQRSRRKEPVICRDYGDGGKFVCSLSRNESFMLELDDGKHVLHRVQKIDQNERIILRPHTFGGKLQDSDKPPLIQRKSPNTLNGYKVTVDPIGRIFPAKD